MFLQNPLNCINLSSLALRVVFSTSSVNTLCILLLNLWCDFNINLLFFYELFIIFSKMVLRCFFPVGLFYSQVKLLLNNVYVMMIRWAAEDLFGLWTHHVVHLYPKKDKSTPK